MERELLIEIGCEELPASWLTPLATQLADRMSAHLGALRLKSDAAVETYATPRRLTGVVARIAERQADHDETVSGPPVSAAYGADGAPTPAAVGFARKNGVDVSELTRIETPKGTYLAYVRKHRGKAAVDVLPDFLTLTLRDLSFPKHMHWDAQLDDGRGELTFGRPIRWLLFLYGGRVVPYAIRRSSAAQSPLVQDVRSGAITYGHRFLAVSGRPGRAVKVRSFSDYQARLAEHFVVLSRHDRFDRITRELDSHARRLGGRLHPDGAALSQDVTDLVEYPSVVAGAFSAEFLDLPAEVLTTTLIHHQHYFPVVDDRGALMPAFLAVTNIEVDQPRKIAVNAERVVTARLRDARFFWESDRKSPLAARLDRLETVLFHKALGTYHAKALRLDALAARVARDAFGAPEEADHASVAGRLAKVDLTTDMVREFTELQGTIGGIYAREDGQPEQVWKAIYFHYLPVGVEPGAPPHRSQLGEAATTWAAVSVADKLDSVVGFFAVGERPTGARDPFGLRRQLQGALRVLVDLPELTGRERAVDVFALLDETFDVLKRSSPGAAAFAVPWPELREFVTDRVRHLFAQRGFSGDEIDAALGAAGPGLVPLSVRRRLEALQAMRGSADFMALGVLFKRVKNIAREISPQPQAVYEATLDREALSVPAEQALLTEFDARAPRIRAALAAGNFKGALVDAAGLRPAVDRFFTDVFVMDDDARLRTARLMLMVELRDLVLGIADISQLGTAADK